MSPDERPARPMKSCGHPGPCNCDYATELQTRMGKKKPGLDRAFIEQRQKRR